jgi:hypothetical protein
MVGMVDIRWRFDGNYFYVDIVKGREVLYSKAIDARELEVSITDIIDRVVKKNRYYTDSGLITRIGVVLSDVKKVIMSKMNIWVIDTIMESGIYPLTYEIRGASYDTVLKYLSDLAKDRTDIPYSTIFRLNSCFVIVQYRDVTVFPYDVGKISVIQWKEYKEADTVLGVAYRNGLKLPEDVASVLEYYVLSYKVLKEVRE